MERNREKRNCQLWIDFVKENFQSTAEILKEKNLAFPQDASSSKKEATATSKECECRSCSISLRKIRRKDLSTNITDIVDNKIKESMIKMNDYRARFFSITHMMAIILKNHVFATRNNQVELQESQGYDIRKLLSPKFVEHNQMASILSALPLSTQAIEGNKAQQGKPVPHFSSLFRQRWCLVSYYFST